MLKIEVVPLEERQIAAGERLIRKIEEVGGEVPGALWIHNPDIHEWRLFLAMPITDAQGPAAGMELVSQAIALLRAEGDHTLSRQIISPVSVLHDAIWQFASAVGTGMDLQRLRIQGMRINGHVIQDVLIYRLHKPNLKLPEQAA
jgi:hypothetical protein